VRFGPRTARAVSRYLRARAKHKAADLPGLWLAERGIRPLAPNGIKIMLKRRGLEAGLVKLHAHRWRHTFAHEWKRAGGDTGDLMLLLGWTSQEMPRRYGASAAAERAQETHQRIGVGDRV
jgi:integrase/recombinase XerC